MRVRSPCRGQVRVREHAAGQRPALERSYGGAPRWSARPSRQLAARPRPARARGRAGSPPTPFFPCPRVPRSQVFWRREVVSSNARARARALPGPWLGSQARCLRRRTAQAWVSGQRQADGQTRPRGCGQRRCAPGVAATGRQRPAFVGGGGLRSEASNVAGTAGAPRAALPWPQTARRRGPRGPREDRGRQSVRAAESMILGGGLPAAVPRDNGRRLAQRQVRKGRVLQEHEEVTPGHAEVQSGCTGPTAGRVSPAPCPEHLAPASRTGIALPRPWRVLR